MNIYPRQYYNIIHFLLILCCFVVNSYGSQVLTSNEKAMLEFVNKIGGVQKIGIYHNGDDKLNNKSCDAVMDAYIESLKTEEKEHKEYCIVYRYEIHTREHNNASYGVTNKRDPDAICNLNKISSNKKGLLLYRTAIEDGRGHDENYFSSCVQEIKSLMQGGWIVCVDTHDVQFARDFNKEFANEYKEVLIQGRVKDNFFSSVLLIGGMIVICALLYFKFCVVKK